MPVLPVLPAPRLALRALPELALELQPQARVPEPAQVLVRAHGSAAHTERLPATRWDVGALLQWPVPASLEHSRCPSGSTTAHAEHSATHC